MGLQIATLHPFRILTQRSSVVNHIALIYLFLDLEPNRKSHVIYIKIYQRLLAQDFQTSQMTIHYLRQNHIPNHSLHLLLSQDIDHNLMKICG